MENNNLENKDTGKRVYLAKELGLLADVEWEEIRTELEKQYKDGIITPARYVELNGDVEEYFKDLG